MHSWINRKYHAAEHVECEPVDIRICHGIEDNVHIELASSPVFLSVSRNVGSLFYGL